MDDTWLQSRILIQCKPDDSPLSGFKSLIISIFQLLKGGLQGRDGQETGLVTKNFNKQFIKQFWFFNESCLSTLKALSLLLELTHFQLPVEFC